MFIIDCVNHISTFVFAILFRLRKFQLLSCTLPDDLSKVICKNNL